MATAGALKFDLRSVLKQADVERAEPQVVASFGSLGILFAASVFDATHRALERLGALWLWDLLDLADVLLRTFVLSLAVVLAADLSAKRAWELGELRPLGTTYFVLACASLVLYVVERLVGRYQAPGGASKDGAAGSLALQLFNRRAFSSPFHAAVVTTVVVVGASAVSLALRWALHEVDESELIRAAVAVYVTSTTAYSIARLSRFGLIGEQSVYAAHAAGFGTLLELLACFPFGVAFLIDAARRHELRSS